MPQLSGSVLDYISMIPLQNETLRGWYRKVVLDYISMIPLQNTSRPEPSPKLVLDYISMIPLQNVPVAIHQESSGFRLHKYDTATKPSEASKELI